MKNKKLFLSVFTGALVCFVGFILASVLFQKFNFFDFGNRSFENIVIESLVVSVFFFVFMFLFSKKRLKRKAEQ